MRHINTFVRVAKVSNRAADLPEMRTKILGMLTPEIEYARSNVWHAGFGDAHKQDMFLRELMTEINVEFAEDATRWARGYIEI